MGNEVIKSGLKNSFFVIMAQFVSFLLGIAKALVLPIILGITNFGYWQVYLLYLSYVGVFAFGFNDGIYLRYGKHNYEDLPKLIFRSSIKFFIVVQVIVMIIVSSIIFLEPDTNKQIAMIWASINIPIAGLSGVLIYILQVTNQLKKYSFYTVLDKIILFVIIMGIFAFKTDQFILLIIVDTLSKIIVLSLMLYSCRDLVFGQGCSLKPAFKEVFENISIGIKLMLANLAGMLVLGFGQYIVERFENVEIYGTYSFALSTTNLVLVFVSAIGLVIYPTLNRLDENRYSNYFIVLNKIFGFLIFGLLLSYFPLRIFISSTLKEYIKVLDYLPIIFAIVFIQAKMQILINPYYKLLREEKAMLYANIIGFLMAILLILPLYFITNSVSMIAVGTFLAMGIRAYLSEVYLKKVLFVKDKSNMLIEISGVMIFILFAYQNNLAFGFLGYFIVFCIFMIRHLKILSKYFKHISRW